MNLCYQGVFLLEDRPNNRGETSIYFDFLSFYSYNGSLGNSIHSVVNEDFRD